MSCFVMKTPILGGSSRAERSALVTHGHLLAEQLVHVALVCQCSIFACKRLRRRVHFCACTSCRCSGNGNTVKKHGSCVETKCTLIVWLGGHKWAVFHHYYSDVVILLVASGHQGRCCRSRSGWLGRWRACLRGTSSTGGPSHASSL
jgi:hypothetical protein